MTRGSVSIAMATYQGERYLAEQLESIAAQTRLPEELVICDDGSRDATLETARCFAESAQFEVRIHTGDAPLGATSNFERAVRECRGDIVFLADQDDVWQPGKIATQASHLEQRPEVGACFSNALVVGSDREPLGYRLWESLWFGANEQALVTSGEAAPVFLKHVVAAGTTLAFRARHRDLVLPFADLRSCHDAWIAFLISAADGISLIDQDLVLYRVHAGNQIGLEKPSLLQQVAKARSQLERDEVSNVPDAFAYAAEFFEAALERLTTSCEAQSRPSGTLDSALRSQIEQKIAHSRRRSRMPSSMPMRIPHIFAEAVNGNYWRYAYGVKSIAQDLWLR